MCASIRRNSNGNWEQLGADIDGEAAGDYSGDSVSLSREQHRRYRRPQKRWQRLQCRPCAHLRVHSANSAQQGDILSATFSDLMDADGAVESTTYQWQSSSDDGLSWTDLSGETNQQIDTSAQSLVGLNIRVTATTTDALGGSTSFISAAQTIANVDDAATGTLAFGGNKGPPAGSGSALTSMEKP